VSRLPFEGGNHGNHGKEGHVENPAVVAEPRELSTMPTRKASKLLSRATGLRIKLPFGARVYTAIPTAWHAGRTTCCIAMPMDNRWELMSCTRRQGTPKMGR